MVTGCGAGTPAASAGTTTTTTSPSSTAVSTSTSATQTQPTACGASDLSVAKGKGGVGGGSAYSRVQQSNAGNLDPADCDPQPVEGLRVTPPDDTGSVFVAAEGTGCAAKGLLRVGAVAMGSGE
jgi:hypothetical protein